MEEIKRRMTVLDAFLSGQSSAIFLPTAIETTCLQLRKILELIALASLVANEKAYSSAYRDFAKHWNAGELLKSLSAINPQFYPVPVVELPTDQPGVKHQLKERDPDYLTKDNFVELYGRCGVIMHAANPFGRGINYEFYKANLPLWRQQIINLLNNHQIRLKDSHYFYLIHMQEERDEKVHFYKFEPKDRLL